MFAGWVPVIARVFGLAVVVAVVAEAQSPPKVELPSELSKLKLFANDRPVRVIGAVVAYNWADRSYMEGAWQEDFIFRIEEVIDGVPGDDYLRVRYIWHPADKAGVMPTEFWRPGLRWRITAAKPSPMLGDDLCSRPAQKVVTVLTDNSRIELTPFVEPGAFVEDATLTDNIKSAIRVYLKAPVMPDPDTLPCMELVGGSIHLVSSGAGNTSVDD